MAAKGKSFTFPPLTRKAGRQSQTSQSTHSRQRSNYSTASTCSSRSSNADLTLDKLAETMMHLCNQLKASNICRYNKLRKANEVIINCLVKRGQRERRAIQHRFKQLYSLDLETLLRESLGKEFGEIIDGLLLCPYSKAAMDMHQLIEDLDPFVLVDQILLSSRKYLTNVCAVYKRQFGVSLIADVHRNFGDVRVSRLLTALVRGVLWPSAFTGEAVLEAAREAESQETMLLEETGIVLVGLQKYGPDFLKAVSDAHRVANPGGNSLLLCIRATYNPGLHLLARKLLDEAEGECRTRELVSRLDRLSGSCGQDLVHQLLVLGECPRVLRDVNRQLLMTRDASLRDLVLRRCPRDCANLLAAILTATGSGAAAGWLG